MAYTEYNIDGQYALFARFYCAFSASADGNPFFSAHRPHLSASKHLAGWNQMDGEDIFAALSNQDKLVPMTANLVMPTGDGPFPLAILIHGNARAFFKDINGTLTAIPEVKSYRGYQYLQYYMADRGVASLSINCNVINEMDLPYDCLDEQHRVQMALLWLVLLRQLSGTALTTGQPIYMRMSQGGTVSELQEAMNVTTGTAEGLMQALRTAIRNKLNLAQLGFMGHSRGGGAVQLVETFFKPRVGARPVNLNHRGPASSKEMPVATDGNATHLGVGVVRYHDLLYHYMLDLAGLLGNPTMASVKTVVALQPSMTDTTLTSGTTFFLVIASSHDTDADDSAYASYYEATCPKAFMFSHGASHGRFNTVWRQLDYINLAINRQIACQSPIHLLSNAGHEEAGKAMIANALIAGLKDEHHRLRFYTGEVRATSLGQDIERGWKFAFPFSSPPAIVGLTRRTLTARNISRSPVTTITGAPEALQFYYPFGDQIFAEKTSPLKYIKPAADRVQLSLPVQPADQLVAKTHFSFIYGFEYNCRSRRERRRVNLQNFSVRLLGGGSAIGSVVDGRDVRVKSLVAYPTFDLPGGTCTDDTKIVLQTAEIELAQFLSPTQLSPTDMSLVNEIQIELKPSGRSGNAVWFFNDFALTSRNLPTPPSGFAIP